MFTFPVSQTVPEQCVTKVSCFIRTILYFTVIFHILTRFPLCTPLNNLKSKLSCNSFSYWSDPEKIDNVENLRQMEDLLRESIQQIRLQKVRHLLILKYEKFNIFTQDYLSFRSLTLFGSVYHYRRY